MDTKRCCRCGETKPLSEFHRDRCEPGGFDSRCKRCRSANPAQYDEKQRLRREHAEREGMKFCTLCREWKPLTAFTKYSEAPDGLRRRCKECKRSQENPETKRRRDKEYRRENRAKIRAGQRRWRRENPEKALASERRRRESNAANIVAAHQRNRAKKAGASGDFTGQEWLDLCARYGNRCLCCGATDKPLTVDHVIPLRKGGTNDIGNIQPLCHTCNTRKSDRSTDYRPDAAGS